MVNVRTNALDFFGGPESYSDMLYNRIKRGFIENLDFYREYGLFLDEIGRDTPVGEFLPNKKSIRDFFRNKPKHIPYDVFRQLSNPMGLQLPSFTEEINLTPQEEVYWKDYMQIRGATAFGSGSTRDDHDPNVGPELTPETYIRFLAISDYEDWTPTTNDSLPDPDETVTWLNYLNFRAI